MKIMGNEYSILSLILKYLDHFIQLKKINIYSFMKLFKKYMTTGRHIINIDSSKSFSKENFEPSSGSCGRI